MNIFKDNKGYITLGNVITVGSMALAVAVSLLIIGINSYESTHTVEEAVIAQSLSDACGEVALNELKLNDGYIGNETIAIEDHSCDIEPLIFNVDGSITINTIGYKNDVVRKTQIIISGTKPSLQLESWREVADF
ncbi:MAG: hypothetical protein ABIC57_00445 [bacterium]